MFPGYLAFGGTEVMNQDLTYTLVELSDCPAGWIRCKPCPGITNALGQTEVDNVIQNAPWYDVDDPATGRFYGFYPVDVEGAEGSTRTATIVEGIMDGGVVQGTRRAVGQIRVRGVMIGRGHDALDAGLSWLDAVLDGDQCSTHTGGSCGEVDICFFITCPPPRGFNEDGSPWTDEEYDAILDPLWRRIHGVTAISGPLVLSHFHNEDYHAYEVEFTLAATTPYVFNLPKSIDLTPTTPTVVQDSPFNLTPYPSAELSSGTYVVATNYSTNPSLEVSAANWAVASDGTNILTANVVGIQSTDFPVVGANSYRVTFTAPGASAGAGWFGGQQVVALPTTAGVRFSVNVWATALVVSGTMDLTDITYEVQWRSAANTVLRTDVLDTKPLAGGAVSAKSIQPPATTTNAVVRVRANAASWASGAVGRIFIDALAVTVP